MQRGSSLPDIIKQPRMFEAACDRAAHDGTCGRSTRVLHRMRLCRSSSSSHQGDLSGRNGAELEVSEMLATREPGSSIFHEKSGRRFSHGICSPVAPIRVTSTRKRNVPQGDTKHGFRSLPCHFAHIGCLASRLQQTFFCINWASTASWGVIHGPQRTAKRNRLVECLEAVNVTRCLQRSTQPNGDAAS